MAVHPASLTPILHAYAALDPVSSIALPPATTFTSLHDFLLHNILLDAHLEHYPPAREYQHRFWKWALVQLERLQADAKDDDDDNEIDDRIYRYYTNLVSVAASPSHDVPLPTYTTYFCEPPGARITLLESRATVVAGTTGLRTWRASRVLGTYLARNPSLVAHSTVLELGAGAGFLGVLVASLQQQLHTSTPATSLSSTAAAPSSHRPALVLTDVHPAVLALCQHNVSLPCNRSSAHPCVSYRLVDWCDAQGLPAQRDQVNAVLTDADADVVVGADIVFDPVLVPPLVATLSLALSCARTRMAFVAVTLRNEATVSYFLSEIRIQKDLVVEDMDHDVTGPPDQVDAGLPIKILRITTRT